MYLLIYSTQETILVMKTPYQNSGISEIVISEM
jgi:hypothetical protein